MLEQVGDPFGIFDIRFPSRNCLDMLGVAQQKLHLSFQDVPNTLPIDTCTLHSHGLAALSFEPISQPQEIRHHRAERLDLLLYSLGGNEEETGHDHLLVDINPATAVIQDLHRFLTFRISVLVDEACQVGYQEQRESSVCFSSVRATFGGA